jgi:site-specific DNA recombinase
MKDIKKTRSGPQLRTDRRGGVSQADLFTVESAIESDQQRHTAPAGAAGLGAANARVAVYARVSSEQQEKEETIASQLETIASFASEHGLGFETQDVFVDDGYSAKVLRRPGLDMLLDRVYEGHYEGVLVLDPDRLARSYGHQIMLIEEFERKGCKPVFVRHPIGEGPDEDLLLQMQGVIAQYEHAKILERTRRGKLHRMRRGELVSGQRVFGYEYVKAEGAAPAHYQIIEAEAQVVRRIFQWHTEEGLSLRQIAAGLQEQGVATVRGGRWNGANIGHMLRNSIYMGTGYAHKFEAVEPKDQPNANCYRRTLKSARRRRPREEWQPFAAPAIVSEELFELAQQRLSQNKQLAARRTRRPYLLRGLIKCECCQMHMFCDTQSSSYICGLSRPLHARDRGRPPCSNKRRLPVSQLDELIWGEVKAILKKPSLLKKHYPELREKIHPRATGSLEAIDRKLVEVQKQISRVNDLFIRGVLDRAQHKEKYDQLHSQLSAFKTRREKLAEEHLENQEIAELMASFTAFAKTIGATLEQADFKMRRSIVEQLVKEVSIGNSSITISFLAPLKRNNLCRNLD